MGIMKMNRVERTNELLRLISVSGRRFFYHANSGRVSQFEIAENGRLYFRDKYSDRLLPCSHTKGKAWQRYFSEGGTLKSLVEALANYIKTGKTIAPLVFGPWSPTTCNGDLWGYGADMETVRQHALKLGIITPSRG